MNTEMNIEFGDIFLVDFEPSVGREYKKIRPALVVQMEKITERSPYISVMPMTTQVEQFMLDDVFVEKDGKNALMQDSVIKVHQIMSFDKSRLIKFVGQANSPVLRKVRGYLRRHFGL